MACMTVRHVYVTTSALRYLQSTSVLLYSIVSVSSALCVLGGVARLFLSFVPVFLTAMRMLIEVTRG